MPEPKPPEGYETWLDYVIQLSHQALGITVGSRQVYVYARAELAKLREEAENWDSLTRQRGLYQGSTPETVSDASCPSRRSHHGR